MIVVDDILEECSEALGVSTSSTAIIYRRLNRAVEMLSAKGDWDPLLDVIDVCVQGTCISLPPFVYSVLAVSTENVPLIGRDRYFEFHSNGPGYQEPGTSGRNWREQGMFPTQYEIGDVPGRLIATSEDPIDEDDEAYIWVYGFNADGRRVTSTVDNATVEGVRIPIKAGYTAPADYLPEMLIIERVRKPVTKGRVRLFVDRGTAETAELLGRYEFDEQSPSFLRVNLGVITASARVFFRHRTAKISKNSDVIRLHNGMALLNAVKAVRYYMQDDPEQGAAYEAVATRMLQEQEAVRQPPNHAPIQVNTGATLGSESLLD